MRRFIAAALLCLPTLLAAQQAERIISPGMTRAQVIAALGAPSTQRTASEYVYMFYPNACGRACGMNDLVILKGDSVADAIFRSPNRHYTGTSSSPEQATPEVSPRPTHRAAKPMTKPTTSAPAAKASTPAAAKTTAPSPMKPPAKANDAKPSIPVKPTPMPPAQAKTTAPLKPTATDKTTPG